MFMLYEVVFFNLNLMNIYHWLNLNFEDSVSIFTEHFPFSCKIIIVPKYNQETVIN